MPSCNHIHMCRFNQNRTDYTTLKFATSRKLQLNREIKNPYYRWRWRRQWHRRWRTWKVYRWHMVRCSSVPSKFSTGQFPHRCVYIGAAARCAAAYLAYSDCTRRQASRRARRGRTRRRAPPCARGSWPTSPFTTWHRQVTVP